MSQLARQWEVREPYRKQQQMEQPAISPRRKITKGEKWLWALGIGILNMLSVVIVSKQAEIYLTNRDISHVQSQIEKVADDNKKLHVQKTQLMDPKRIIEYAEKHGYTLNIDNVKVVK